MIKIKPFQCLRPSPEKVEEVISPPYDVLDSEEAREKAQNKPNHFLHVIKPEIDLDPNIDPHDPRVYAKGAENLKKLIDKEILIKEDQPCFYIYKLRMGDHEQAGIVASASVEDYLENRIKSHEHTHPDKEKDRTDHIDSLNAQTGPVILTYRTVTAIIELINHEMTKAPIYDLVADYDIQHTLYKVSDEVSIKKLQDAFTHVDALYIADGHHRSAAASRVRNLRMKHNPNHTGEESYNYFLTVIFPDSQLQILDYNRVAEDLNGMNMDTLLSRLNEKFEVEPYSSDKPYKPEQSKHFGMYLKGQWIHLHAKKGTYNPDDPIEDLDVAILQNNVLTPILGMGDPRTEKRLHFVGGIRGLNELERLVDSGKYAVAFSMFPTRIDQLMAVADAGKVMPPKSTWFEPKLGSGLFVYMLD